MLPVIVVEEGSGKLDRDSGKGDTEIDPQHQTKEKNTWGKGQTENPPYQRVKTERS